MKHLMFFVLACLVLTGGRTYGQDDTATNANPAMNANDEVRHAARLALAQGVTWLKQKATADSEGWVIGPYAYRVGKVVGYTNVEVHYTTKMVWIPRYSYTSVVSIVQDTAGAPMRKVVSQQAVKQIGSNLEERVLYDPKGPIVKQESHPVYEGENYNFWTGYAIGDAAMAAYALRKSGLPATDPVLQGVLANLQNHIKTLGLPDQTWNLAWLTVIFSGTPGEEAEALTQRLASRLLDGQITDGVARGFWGTISVNHGLLAAMLRDYLAMMAELPKKELKLKEKTNSKAMQAAVDELRSSMERQKTIMESEVCQRVLRLSGVENSWLFDSSSYPQIMLAGTDHMFYNQTVADIGSTWVALFALSVAAENNRLPVESWRPKVAHKLGAPASSRLPPPEKSQAVLARAANALVAGQAQDGCWNECNMHQPVTQFDGFKGFLPVPCDPKSFQSLASPVTPLSARQGIAALDSIGTVVGMKRLLTSFKAPYLSGAKASQKEIETRLLAVWPTPTVPPKFTRDDYDMYLVLSQPLAGIAVAGAPPMDNDKLARALILASGPTGSWGKGLNAWTAPSSARARFEVLKGPPYEMSKAHILPANATPVGYSPLTRDAEGVSTAVAVLYLASYVQNPAATLQELVGMPQLDDLRKEAVKMLTVSNDVPSIRAVPVDAKPKADESLDGDVPVIPVTPVDAKPKADESF